MSKLWQAGSTPQGDGSRQELTARVEAFTVGEDHLLDARLLPYDLQASAVHLAALEKAGILTPEEVSRLQKGLERILELWKSGKFEILPEHEDGHTAIELWLTGELGELGKKIHTGRSRNDQVLTAVRLYEKERLAAVGKRALDCASAWLKLAESHSGIPMPGYTHTRKAMLSSVGQWLGGFVELLLLQVESSRGVETLTDRSPLGTAAGFGTSIDLDRDAESDALGFSAPLHCATSAQLSRGWVELQLVQWLAGLTVIPARLCGELIRFGSEAYGYLTIDPAFCTGSSIMPNKRNPDVAELIRGKHALMAGYAATLQAVTANLGSGYHRDLQLTKGPVIGAFETAIELLGMSESLAGAITFDEKVLREACTPDLMAAEQAYKRVREEGMSFREAYHLVKSGTDAGETIDPDELLASYTQLGSPGNPGLDRLGALLERLTTDHAG